MARPRTWFLRLTVVSLLAAVSWAAPAEAAGTTPGAPTAVSATAGPSQATVRFTPGPSNGSAIVEFGVTCTPDNGTSNRYRNGTSSPITVPSMTPGTAYRCKVQARNSAGWGSFSSLSGSVTPTSSTPSTPSAPTGVSATAGPSQATVRFTPGPARGGAVSEFSATCTPTAGGSNRYGRAAASPVTVTSMTPGTAYHCRVQARNSAGWGSFSAWSNTVTPTGVGSQPLFSDTWSAPDGSPWGSSWATAHGHLGGVETAGGKGFMWARERFVSNARAQLIGLASRGDADLRFSYQWSSNRPTGYFSVNLRGSGGWEIVYRPRNGYGVQFSSSSSIVYLSRSVNGAATFPRSVNAQPLTTGKRWVRFQVQGSQIRFRTWADGQAEPATWNATLTDTGVTAPGQLFLSLVSSDDAGEGSDVAIDDLTVRSLP